MSTLLDVLQKRRSPARTAAASDDVVQARDPLPVSLDHPTQLTGRFAVPDLQLAPETSGESDAEPTLAATVQVAAPLAAPAAEKPAWDSDARRWTDSATPESPDAAPRVAAAPAAASPPVSAFRARLPLILTVVAAIVGATLWLGYQLVAPSADSFTVDPSVLTPVDEVSPLATEGGEAAASAVVPTAAPRKRRRQVEETAWYDVPALPAEPAAAAEPVITITRGGAVNPLYDKVRAAYDALTAGDAVAAEALYREVLDTDPANVDAMLGLAALAARGGRSEEARDLYRQVQTLDPRNATALAALSALPGTADPVGAAGRLKSVLRDQPDSAALHFALGLQYASAGNWPDAQNAFFDAVRNEPTNADYAFNLAVSLDRLGASQPAMSYYQRALDLANGSQQFDPVIIRARLSALGALRG